MGVDGHLHSEASLNLDMGFSHSFLHRKGHEYYRGYIKWAYKHTPYNNHSNEAFKKGFHNFRPASRHHSPSK
jgi:hypothetical protein